MAGVSIQKLRRPEAEPAVLEPVNRLFDDLRRRAYELFERRGYAGGWEVHDWLQAERELLWPSLAELSETDQEYQVRVAAPGLDAKDIQVTATPQWIMVHGESREKREGGNHGLRFSEFSGRRLYRRFDLPSPVDVDAISVKLEKGILTIRAGKAGQGEKEKKRKKKAAAA